MRYWMLSVGAVEVHSEWQEAGHGLLVSSPSQHALMRSEV